MNRETIQRIDARGEICPVPVVRTKSLLNNVTDNGVVVTIVDNEIAVENLKKMADSLGYSFSSRSLYDGDFEVIVGKGNGKIDEAEFVAMEDVNPAFKSEKKTSNLVVINSKTMGDGDEELGGMLLKGFIYALTETEVLPENIVFYNSGVFLTCENSKSLEDLIKLQEKGVKIYSCGLCLDFYKLSEKLKVGEVTNMYAIIEMMNNSTKVIKP